MMRRGWITLAIFAVSFCANAGIGQPNANGRVLDVRPSKKTKLSVIPPAKGGGDLCEAKIKIRVAALEDPNSFLAAGSMSSGLTQYWSTPDHVDRFCFQGGYCYPAHVNRSGKMVEVMAPRKCRIDWSNGDTDSDGVLHGFTLIRSEIPASALRYNDLEAFLENKGMCSACAPGAAEAYIKVPKSACGRFVQRLIDGDPEAARDASTARECS